MYWLWFLGLCVQSHWTKPQRRGASHVFVMKSVSIFVPVLVFKASCLHVYDCRTSAFTLLPWMRFAYWLWWVTLSKCAFSKEIHLPNARIKIPRCHHFPSPFAKCRWWFSVTRWILRDLKTNKQQQKNEGILDGWPKRLVVFFSLFFFPSFLLLVFFQHFEDRTDKRVTKKQKKTTR